MKYAIVFLTIVAASSLTFAEDQENDPNQQNNYPYKSNGDPNYRYQGTGGTQYQYDLSKPNDQIRYETDVRAQMRDELNVDPRREIDQSLGRVGGGIQR